MSSQWEVEDLAAEQAPQQIPFAEYWSVIVRRWRLIAFCVAASLGTAALLSLMAEPTYQASVTLSVERPSGSALSTNPLEPAGGGYHPEFLPTQIRLMRSREIAERVVRKLKLVESSDPEDGNKTLSAGKTQPSQASQNAVTARALALQGSTTVEPIRGTNLVEIAYEASSPAKAARIANAIAEAYVGWNLEEKFRTLSETGRFLSGQIEELKSEIATKEQALLAYGRQKDILAADPSSNTAIRNLESLNQDYATAVAERVAKEARYAELRNAGPEAIAETVASGAIHQMRSDQARLEREYAEKLNLYKPEWPAMQQLKTQIDKGRQQLDSLIQRTVGEARETARNDYQTALRREASLRGVLGSQKSQAMVVTGNAVEYNNLRAEIDTKKALLDTLSKRLGETEVLSGLRAENVSDVRIVDRALPPGSRHSPSYKKNAIIGLLAGLVLGVGLAFGLSYLDRSLRSGKDVERHLHLPLLGIIPSVGAVGQKSYGYFYGSKRTRKKKESEEEAATIELLPHHHSRSRIAERYRGLRTSLLLSRAGGVKSLVITSSFSQEGKTATASNLAVVMAQLGKRTLLVDTDLHRPKLHEIFRVSNRTGLVSVLAEDVEPARAITKTDVPDLFLVPSGPSTPNPSGLLSSESMSKFLELAAMNFDFVILDGPPVLPVADSLVIGSQTDGVVICVQGGKTPREQVVRSRDRLLRSNVRILGVVINNLEEGDDEYGSRYGYDDAYYYGARTQDVPERAAVSGRTI